MPSPGAVPQQETAKIHNWPQASTTNPPASDPAANHRWLAEVLRARAVSPGQVRAPDTTGASWEGVRVPHNPEVLGSNPTPATTQRAPDRQVRGPLTMFEAS